MGSLSNPLQYSLGTILWWNAKFNSPLSHVKKYFNREILNDVRAGKISKQEQS